MQRPPLNALCAGCSLLIASSSFAATIEPGGGDLSINQGQGFKAVNSVEANVGDSVMVGLAVPRQSCMATVGPQPGDKRAKPRFRASAKAKEDRVG